MTVAGENSLHPINVRAPGIIKTMKWLTKSDYLKYLIHPAYLWLQKHAKDKLPPFDESVQAILDAGNEVDGYARGLFEEGVIVESLFDESIRDTETFVAAGKTTIFQAAVLTDRRLYAKADVLTKNSDGSWDLHEVKSATKERPDYIADLAFQKIAFEESGYAIKRTHLIHINNQYIRRGAINPQHLFTQIDITEKVDHILSLTKRGIVEALDIIALKECPDDGLANVKNWYGWRDTYRHLHPDIPATSILNLTRLKPEQLRELTKLGISNMTQIPADFELGSQQINQLAAIKERGPIIRPQKIQHHMSKLHFPLYFFDFETTGGAVPPYEGTKPYQQIPFQYSLHVLHEPEGELEHFEFLHEGRDNPMPSLLKQMREDIGDTGSVVVWFKGFEGGVNELMADLYPEYSVFICNVNARLYDLMEVFSNFYYIDARFGGSASIKNVLPVLVPELSYKTLGIQKGDVAALRWKQAAFGTVGEPTAAEIFNDLRVYCGQDTLAMVRIYEFLLEVKETSPGAQMSLL